MSDNIDATSLAILKTDEGFRSLPYRDTEGHLSIGYGRNLDVGITKSEADMFFTNDVDKCRASLSVVDWFGTVNEVRRGVLLNMCYNLGFTKLCMFKHMIAALRSGDYNRAAAEILNSRAAEQLPGRYGRLANAMRNGVW